MQPAHNNSKQDKHDGGTKSTFDRTLHVEAKVGGGYNWSCCVAFVQGICCPAQDALLKACTERIEWK